MNDRLRDPSRPQSENLGDATGAAKSFDAESRSEFALVPEGGLFEGQVAVVGQTRVEGRIRGSLQGPGTLVLGPQSKIEGRIECEALSSRGAIVGPVVARKHAHFGDGARLEGDLRALAVEVDGDVIWNGTARVGR
ncbi:MAG: polymer-forming cytoskeletal protein [Myxococcales bacterium]|nr:polymer-forming cytoskeletal protein [Myxococcales bacterium]HIK85063.1 polymer-forming cytoskeletal protein [Myxococcales bacterium]